MSKADPTYEYVKGVGWTVVHHETITYEQDGWRITVIARIPREGERWFAEAKGRSLSDTVTAIKRHYTPGRIGNTWSTLVSGMWTNLHIRERDYYNWVTILQEKL